MKGATIPLRCPACRGVLEVPVDWEPPAGAAGRGRRSSQQEGLRCPHCGRRFPVVGGVLDLRPGAAARRGRWRLEDFERAYREAGLYRDRRDWARRSGIPPEVEEFRHPYIKGWLIDQLTPEPGQSLLDVGCGSGFLLFDIRERHPGLRLCGVDVSPAHLASLLRRKRDDGVPDILALAADGEDLPFPDATFDWVTTSEVLEHVHRPERALREMYRVLKPGGTLLVTTPNRAAVLLWQAVFFLPRAVRRLFRRRRPEARGAYDEPLSAPRLRSALERAGFVVEEFRPVVFLPHESYFQFFPRWLVRWWLWRARFIERHLRWLCGWQGLHHVVRARKADPPRQPRRKPKRVLYVIDDLMPGGAERVLVDVALRLPRDRFEVSVLTLFGEGPLAEELRREGLSVACLGLSRRNPLSKAAFLWWYLRRIRPAIVHLFRIGARVFAGPVAWAAGVPRRIGRWDNFPKDEPPSWRLLDRVSARFLTGAEACSEAVARALRRDFLPPRLRPAVTRNGTPLRSLPPGARRRARRLLGVGTRELVVGTVANLHWRKGYPCLLRAAALVRDEEPRFRLFCIGAGPKESLEDLARQLGLEAAVKFLGRRLDVPQLLPGFDVFVLASVTEPFGVVLAEAMAAGLPCVATRVGGIPEVVAEGETGLLVPAGDPEALAQAVLRLLRDPGLRRRMGRAGRRRVREHFSIERMTADVERMYEALLGGAATAGVEPPARPRPEAAGGAGDLADHSGEPPGEPLGPPETVTPCIRRYRGRRCGHPPRISVLIPSLDGYRGGNVPRLLGDLARQTEQDFEVLVVIGVRPNGRARNVGAREARGRYLVSIDDDVRLGDERVLENLIRPFEERRDVGLVGASQLLPAEASAFEVRAARELPRARFPVQEHLVDTDQVSHLCLAMPRELYWRLGGENEVIPSGTDPDLRRRVRQAGLRVVVAPRTWAFHPGPRSLAELLRTSYRKARDSRWVSRHYPELAIDLSAGPDRGGPRRRSSSARAGRLLVQVAGALLEARLLFVAGRLAWAAGWLHEHFRPRERGDG